MLRRLYLSPLGLIVSAALHVFGCVITPFMIYGYWNRSSRDFKRRTRISSSTILIGRSNIDIGDDCWIGHHSIIDGSNGVKIGQGVQIAGLTGIYSHSSHNAIRSCGKRYIELHEDERPGYIRASVEIGDFSFIGVSTVILPGVKIGKGCIIGAASLVNIDIPDHSIAVGSPVKIVGNTLDADASFFSDPDVRANYYDLEAVKEYLLANKDQIRPAD
jgi:acetyltransferase-like isoleucine patch superfamily enzyme